MRKIGVVKINFGGDSGGGGGRSGSGDPARDKDIIGRGSATRDVTQRDRGGDQLSGGAGGDAITTAASTSSTPAPSAVASPTQVEVVETIGTTPAISQGSAASAAGTTLGLGDEDTGFGGFLDTVKSDFGPTSNVTAPTTRQKTTTNLAQTDRPEVGIANAARQESLALGFTSRADLFNEGANEFLSATGGDPTDILSGDFSVDDAAKTAIGLTGGQYTSPARAIGAGFAGLSAAFGGAAPPESRTTGRGVAESAEDGFVNTGSNQGGEGTTSAAQTIFNESEDERQARLAARQSQRTTSSTGRDFSAAKTLFGV